MTADAFYIMVSGLFVIFEPIIFIWIVSFIAVAILLAALMLMVLAMRQGLSSYL